MVGEGKGRCGGIVLSEDDNFLLDMAIFHEICKKMEKELKMSHNASLIHNMTAIHMRLN